MEKLKKQLNLYTIEGEIKSVFYTNKPMILLVYKEVYFNVNNLDHVVPSMAISLLQDFEDVFLEDILSRLPPLKGMEHQINHVPRVVIPNQLACRSNSKKIKELQKQVDKLMMKRYDHKSMSPCVVPMLLVHKKNGT